MRLAKVVVLTHGDLARSLYETVGLFFNERDGLEALCMDVDMEGFKAKLRQSVMDSPEEEILILVDLFGGTPFNMAAAMMGDAKNQGKKIEIVSGVNLPMLLEVTANIPHSSLEELSRIAFDIGRVGIRDLMTEINSKKKR